MAFTARRCSCYSAKHVHAGSIEEFNTGRQPRRSLRSTLCREFMESSWSSPSFGMASRLPEAEVSVAVDDAEAVKKTTDENGRR